MTPMRIRTLNASAGLLTALTLGVASLAGCAPFDPNPAGAAGGLNTPPATTAATTAGNPAVTPSAKPTVAPVAMQVIKVAAKINDQPLANALITAIDLSTGKTVPLVAAGSMNRRLSQTGGLTTNGQGNAEVSVPAVKGKSYKLVIKDKASGKGVSTVIGTNQNGSVRSIEKDGESIELNEETTLSTGTLESLFALAGDSQEANAGALLDKFFDASTDALAKFVPLTDAQKQAIVTGVDDSGTLPPAVLDTLVTVDGAIKDYFKDVTTIMLQSVVSSGNAGVEGQAEDYAKSLANLADFGFDVKVVDGKLSITGNGVEISLEEVEEPAADPSTNPSTDPSTDPSVAPSTEPSVEPSVDPIVDDPIEETLPDDELGTNLTPTITVSGSATDSNSLTLTVSQQAGEEDVELIVAKLNKDVLGAEFLLSEENDNATLASGTGAGTIFGAGPSFGSDGVFKVVDDASASLEADLESFENIPTDLTTAWMGSWYDKNNGVGKTKIAHVNVFENDTFLYVVIKRVIGAPKNSAVTVHEHTTTMNIPNSVLSFDSTKFTASRATTNAAVEIIVKGRDTGENAIVYRNL